MKAVIIKTDGNVQHTGEIGEIDLDFMQGVVGGYIEVAYLSMPSPNGLAENLLKCSQSEQLVLICNEEGLLHGLPFNILGSMLYGTQIVGDVLLMRRSDLK